MESITSGIYILYYETDDSQYYIGKSINIGNRYRQHCSALKNRTHLNKALVSGYEKYGAPTLDILEKLPCDDTILYSREVYWIEKFNSFKNGMNENMGGVGVGYGEGSPSALYSNTQIQELVVYILANPTRNLVEIAKETNISYAVIKSLVRGNTHTWLSKESPLEYSKLLSLKGTRSHSIGVGESCANSLHSNKQVEEVFKLLVKGVSSQEVSVQTGVSLDTVRNIHSGRVHKWLKGVYPSEYDTLQSVYLARNSTSKWPSIKSPDGTIYTVLNQAQFAETHGIHKASIGRVLNGTRKSHLGWVLASKEDLANQV